jgi:hypothetical protein
MERKMCGHGVPKNWHQKKEEAVPKAKKNNTYAKNNWHQHGQAQTSSKTKRNCTKQSPKP